MSQAEKSNITRRSLVAAGAIAALPAVSAVASAAPDPIFAAIQAHQKAYRAFIDRCIMEDDLSEKGIELECAADDHRTPEMVSAVNASRAARWALTATVPTTLVGLATLLTFVREESHTLDEFFFEEGEEQYKFISSIAQAVQQLAGG